MDADLLAIGRAAATVFRENPYEKATVAKIGEHVELPRDLGRPTARGGRSSVWIHNRVGSKGGTAVLAGLFAWNAFREPAAEIGVAEPVNTIHAARTLATAAFDYVLTFARAERTLLANVRRGLEELPAGDSPLTGDPEAGPIIAAAGRGMCALFAAWLTPILAEACSPVLMMNAQELRTDAERMSDLLTRKNLSDEQQARALCSYWYTLCVVGRAGQTAELREHVEREVHSGTDGKLPLARLAGVLLHGRHDLPTAAATFAQAAAELRAQERWAEASDSLSRSGLAHLYAGDWTSAGRLFADSAALTERHLGPEDPRISRALSNQADLAARTGRPDRALVTIGQAIDRRLQEPGPEGARRLHLSERVKAFALAECGQVGRALKLAERLRAHEDEAPSEWSGRWEPSAERVRSRVRGYRVDEVPSEWSGRWEPSAEGVRSRVRGYRVDEAASDCRGCAEDMLLEAHVLRRAGRVGEALDRLTVAGSAVPATPRNLEALADRAHCLLALQAPQAACAAIAPVLENWDWYARRLSARLVFELVTVSAQADWMLLRPAEAVATLREFRRIASRWPSLPDEDPLFDVFGRALAQILRSTGDLPGARAELRDVTEREQRRIREGRLFGDHPCVAATRLELGECDETQGRADAATAHYRVICDNPVMDDAHPLKLAARLGLARLALGRCDVDAAAEILCALPDPWPLDPDIDVSEEATRLRRKLA